MHNAYRLLEVMTPNLNVGESNFKVPWVTDTLAFDLSSLTENGLFEEVNFGGYSESAQLKKLSMKRRFVPINEVIDNPEFEDELIKTIDRQLNVIYTIPDESVYEEPTSSGHQEISYFAVNGAVTVGTHDLPSNAKDLSWYKDEEYPLALNVNTLPVRVKHQHIKHRPYSVTIAR